MRRQFVLCVMYWVRRSWPITPWQISRRETRNQKAIVSDFDASNKVWCGAMSGATPDLRLNEHPGDPQPWAEVDFTLEAISYRSTSESCAKLELSLSRHLHCLPRYPTHQVCGVIRLSSIQYYFSLSIFFFLNLSG